jgi:hypothetical protein
MRQAGSNLLCSSLLCCKAVGSCLVPRQRGRCEGGHGGLEAVFYTVSMPLAFNHDARSAVSYQRLLKGALIYQERDHGRARSG